MLLAARLASSNRRHLGRVVIGLCFASIDRRELARCVLHRLRGCVQQSIDGKRCRIGEPLPQNLGTQKRGVRFWVRLDGEMEGCHV